MKVAAYQAPLLTPGTSDILGLIRTRIAQCEAEGVAILCCPEAVLGGLADYAENPAQFALRTDTNQLASALAPLASDTVTTIIGFTELAGDGRLFNSTAVFRRGNIIGLYRKLHPAINRSVYSPGCDVPVFRVGELTFGIVICNDSNFSEPAKRMSAQGATALFVPANNGLPLKRADAGLIEESRNADAHRATENGVWIVRADVAGCAAGLMSYGSSEIMRPDGTVVQTARQLSEDLLISKIDVPTPPQF